jgi:hypothetical protein
MRPITGVSAAILLALAFGASPIVRAAGATAYQHPVSWTLPIPGGAACTQLSPGVTVNGHGTQHVAVHIVNGTETVLSSASGTATDSQGNQFQWIYVNHLEFDRTTGEGRFTDRFDLIGKGGAKGYKVYVDWDVTLDVGVADGVAPEEILFFALTSVSPNVTVGDLNCDPI